MQHEYKILRSKKSASTLQYRLTLSNKKRKDEVQLALILAENLPDARQYLQDTLDSSIRGHWNVKDKIEVLKRVGENNYEAQSKEKL